VKHDDWRPTSRLADLLHGRTPYEQAAPAIQSWARFYFYEAAIEVLNAGDIDARRKKLGRIPGNMRPFVEAEIKRLWAMR